VTNDDVLEIIDRLDQAGIEWWIDGGWGVDALVGRQTRAHDDLDLVVRREDVERLEATFSEFRRVREEWPASFVLADSRGRHIDIHPIRLDSQGVAWQERPNGQMVRWPGRAFAARGRIGNREVRCTTAESQVESHLYPGHDDVDRRDIELLCERFGLEPPQGPWPGTVHPKRVRARPSI
jgi:lincosamide nucleotidyltransferase A/C/D/E